MARLVGLGMRSYCFDTSICSRFSNTSSRLSTVEANSARRSFSSSFSFTDNWLARLEITAMASYTLPLAPVISAMLRVTMELDTALGFGFMGNRLVVSYLLLVVRLYIGSGYLP